MKPTRTVSGAEASPEEPARSPRPTEEDDLRQAIAGDRGAFDRLVLSCQDEVVSAAAYYLGNDEDGADAAQEAFIKAYRALAGFRRGSSFKTWVLKITLNTARSLRARARAKKRGGGASAGFPPEAGELRRGPAGEDAHGPLEIADPETSSGPAALLERKEVKEAIEKAIVELDDESREVIVLRDISGQSYEAIADALGVPLGTVKSRVHRARLELQGKLRAFL